MNAGHVDVNTKVPRALRPKAWAKHRRDGRFALIEEVTDTEVHFWREELIHRQTETIAEFCRRWSIYKGYRYHGMGDLPAWVVPGVHVWTTHTDHAFIVVATRSRAWVALEALHEAKGERWLTWRTASAFQRDFYHRPSRFDRVEASIGV